MNIRLFAKLGTNSHNLIMGTETKKQRERAIYKVTLVGFFVNLLLTVGKLLAGIFGRSSAMVADAVHSASDFATDLVVMLFVHISAKPKDEGHEYGHGKFETLATIIIGLALFAVGVGIFLNSINLIKLVMNGAEIDKPALIALIAAAISILAKEILYRYTLITGKKVNSPVVIANAWHHRSDAFSSIGALVGIGGAYLLGEKWRVLDPIAAIVVSLLIAKVSYDLVIPGINELLERSLPKDVEDEILSIIMEDTELSDPHNLRTRRIGSNIAIDIHVRMNASHTVLQSHSATEKLEKRLKEKYGEGTLITVHVEPQF